MKIKKEITIITRNHEVFRHLMNMKNESLNGLFINSSAQEESIYTVNLGYQLEEEEVPDTIEQVNKALNIKQP